MILAQNDIATGINVKVFNFWKGKVNVYVNTESGMFIIIIMVFFLNIIIIMVFFSTS